MKKSKHKKDLIRRPAESQLAKLENVNLQNGYSYQRSPKDRQLNFTTMFVLFFPGKQTKWFLNFCLYVRRIDFEVGPK